MRPMTEPAEKPQPSPDAPKAPKRRLRTFLRWLLLVLAVLALFHRPLFHAGVRFVLIQVAARQNLDLRVNFSGNIFTNLTVRDVLAAPNGKGPSPVKRIAIERVQLDYSLVSLARHGIGEFLQSYEIQNADLQFVALPSKDEEEKKQKRTLAQDLNNILAQPAAYADRVKIENFNISVEAEVGNTVIRDFNVFLHPEQPGYIRVARVEVPKLPVWENLAAETSYVDRNFYIKDLRLSPEVVFDEINFDASRRAEEKGGVQLKSRMFGGTLELSLAGTQLKEKGENLDRSYDTTLKIDAADIRLEEAAAYFKLPKPPVARVGRLNLVFTGQPEKPLTWKGNVNGRLESIVFDETKVDAITLTANFLNGRADLRVLDLAIGKNSAEFTAAIGLPASVNDFERSEVDANLRIDAPELETLTARLPKPLTGSGSATGKAGMRNGLLTVDLAVEAKGVANSDLGLGAARLSVHATKALDLPKGTSLFAQLSSKITGELQAVRFETFRADRVQLDASSENELVTFRTLEVSAGENRISAQGTYQLPKPGEPIEALPLDAQFTIKAPDLASFGIVANGQAISGRLQANGEVHAVAGQYTGGVQIEGGPFHVGDFTAELLSGKIDVSGNIAVVSQLTLQLAGEERLSLQGKCAIVKPFAYEGTLQNDTRDLSAFQPLLTVFNVREPIGGALNLRWSGAGQFAPASHRGEIDLALTEGRFGGHRVVEGKLDGSYDFLDRLLKAKGAIKLAQLQTGRIAVHAAASEFDFAKAFGSKDSNPFAGFAGTATAEIDGVKSPALSIDSMQVDAEARGDLVTVRRLTIKRAGNSVAAQGTYRVPRDLKEALKSPIEGEFEIAAPKLVDFGIAVNGQTLSGRLQANGKLQAVNNAYSGQIAIDGGDFRLGGFAARRLAGRIKVADNIAEIEQLALQINGSDQVAILGQIELVAPHAYEGALLVDIKNVSALQPLLAIFDVKEPVRGALKIDWSGQGKVEFVEHSGKLDFALRKGRYGAIDLTEISLAGIYGPGFAESTGFSVISGETSLDAGIEYRERKFKLRDINLVQAKLPAITGFISIPFDPNNPEKLIPFEKRIAANINLRKLDLDRLFQSFGKPSPVTGTITANLLAGGTLLKPTAHLKVSAQALKSKAVAKFAAAEFDAVIHYSNNELTLDTALRQPQIKPLTIKGRAPLDLQAAIENKKIDPQTPIELTVNLPASSLAFVPTVTPVMRRIDGTAAIDVRVSGTIGKPVLSGSAIVDVRGARLADDNIPSIGRFNATVAFADDTLRLSRFDGEIGGGTFKLDGSIRMEQLTAPIFDLRLQSDEILVKRDDTVTVRVDTDVKLTGPLATAAATGNVFLVHSRFFKEIDIMPITLPGRPKPKPREVRQEKPISFPEPPLRDWTFDIAIKTRPEDPFLVRGNLANGAAIADLKLTGTGLEPALEGSVRVEEFNAKLPFSRLKITRGFVYFTKDAPFRPMLDLQAESTMRDYLIHAYIFGSSTDPQVQLTSEPPLPHADIVSLLATGITTNELASNPNALASRAGLLALQQVYRKIFKKGANPEPEQDENSIFDRFEFDLGSTDSRTGQQEVTGRFKVSDQIYIIGDVDVGGEFTGRLKYLLRFR